MKTVLIATIISVLALTSVYFFTQQEQSLFSDSERPTVKQFETCRNAKCNTACPKDNQDCGFSAYYYGNCIPTNEKCQAYEETRRDFTKADDALPDSWYQCEQECGVDNAEVKVDSYPILSCYLECGEYEKFWVESE